MISHEHKAIFIHVPKTAGTSITNYLRKLKFRQLNYHCATDGSNDDATGLFVHGTAWRVSRGLQNIWDEYFKFAFVRNPWDRMVSCYKNRAKSYSDFGKFLNDYPYPKNHNLIWHTIPQLTHVSDLNGNIIVDSIGKYENLQSDFDNFLSDVNIKSTKLPKLNSTKRLHYSEYYKSDKQIEFIYDLYKSEIDRFGYSFETVTKKCVIQKPTYNIQPKIKKEIVVSRYSEQLGWVNKIDKDIDIIVYNKGSNDIDSNFTNRIKSLVSLKNVGREGHTYLSHIIENYDKLADITFFTQGKPHLLGRRLNSFFKNLESKLGSPAADMRIQTNEKSRRHILYRDNDNPPKHCKLALFGRWKTTQKSEKNDLITWWGEHLGFAFPLKEQCRFSYHGTFSVTSEYIKNYPKEFYENLRDRLCGSSAPEEGHFMERSWGEIFNPNTDLIIPKKTIMKQACLIKGSNKIFRIKTTRKTNSFAFERMRGIQKMTYDAIEKFDLKSSFQFRLHMGDSPINNMSYSFSSRSNDLSKTFPDWNFNAWPTAGIKNFTKTIESFSKIPVAKTPKIGWIGSLLNINARKEFVSKYGDTNFTEAFVTPGCFNLNKKKPPRFMTYEEQIHRWKYLIDIRGIGYSGRTKFLFHANRILFLVESPYKEFWYKGLKPWVHYIPVKSDYSDLKKNYDIIESDEKMQLDILSNQSKFAKTNITYENCLYRIKDIIENETTN